jgi:hypothetical protein
MFGVTRFSSRRPVDAVLGLALALALLLPMILGPALVPVTRWLGGADAHLCACGMAPGTCGCPECEKLEQQQLAEHAPHAYPVVRGQCEKDGVAPAYAAMPPMTAPVTDVLVAPSPEVASAREAPPGSRSRGPAEPVTPPPRAAFLG